MTCKNTLHLYHTNKGKQLNNQKQTIMNFTNWLNTMIEEKGLENHLLDLSELDVINGVPVRDIVDYLCQLPVSEQKKVKTILVKIDFQNGDICHFFKHIAKGIITGQL
jgi:hypothetical protein